MWTDPFLIAALVTTGLAAVLILWFLIRRPVLDRATKLVLLLGIGVFPLMTAANGNIAGYHATHGLMKLTAPSATCSLVRGVRPMPLLVSTAPSSVLNVQPV